MDWPNSPFSLQLEGLAVGAALPGDKPQRLGSSSQRRCYGLGVHLTRQAAALPWRVTPRTEVGTPTNPWSKGLHLTPPSQDPEQCLARGLLGEGPGQGYGSLGVMSRFQGGAGRGLCQWPGPVIPYSMGCLDLGPRSCRASERWDRDLPG